MESRARKQDTEMAGLVGWVTLSYLASLSPPPELKSHEAKQVLITGAVVMGIS